MAVLKIINGARRYRKRNRKRKALGRSRGGNAAANERYVRRKSPANSDGGDAIAHAIIELLAPITGDFFSNIAAALDFFDNFNRLGLLGLRSISRVNRKRFRAQRGLWNRDARVALRAAQAAARREARRIYRFELKRRISQLYFPRTGRLGRPRVSGRGQGFRINLIEDFPSTAYHIQPGRGRMGGRKSGQYAYVLNARTDFIGTAQSRAARKIRRATKLRFIQFRGKPTHE